MFLLCIQNITLALPFFIVSYADHWNIIYSNKDFNNATIGGIQIQTGSVTGNSRIICDCERSQKTGRYSQDKIIPGKLQHRITK